MRSVGFVSLLFAPHPVNMGDEIPTAVLPDTDILYQNQRQYYTNLRTFSTAYLPVFSLHAISIVLAANDSLAGFVTRILYYAHNTINYIS